MNDQFSLKFYEDIKSERIDWLWYPYIPFGKITIIQGDPGEGKTSIILSVISALSNGERLPFSNNCFLATSIYQNAEDDNYDTIKPRLEKLKANCRNVCFIENGDGINFDDSERIKEAILKANAKLLVLDPMQAFVGDGVDMNRANVIRPRLSKIKKVAEETGCAIVLIGHMNKNSTSKSTYRGLGSIDIFAAARSVLVVGRLDKESNIRAFAQLKNNLTAKGKTLFFKLEKGTVEWLSECDLTADEILSGNIPTENKMYQAEEFLQRRLFNEPVSVQLLFSEVEELGISIRTLKRAKANLPICSVKKNGCWYWKITEE